MKRSRAIDLPWTIHTPIVSSCAFREGLRDLWRKMTQILGNNARNCYTGVARNPHRIGWRRSRALFSNTCQQRTCLHRLYKHAHKSYNIDRWIPSLRTTSRLVHQQTTTSCLEHALRQRALSRTLRPSHHPSSSSDNGNLRRYQILFSSTSKELSTSTVEGRYRTPIRGRGSSSRQRS